MSGEECVRTLEGHGLGFSLVAFSYNSARLALASYDSTVKIWNSSSGEYFETFNTGRELFNISFDTASSYLRTDTGLTDMSVSPALDTTNISRLSREFGWSVDYIQYREQIVATPEY